MNSVSLTSQPTADATKKVITAEIKLSTRAERHEDPTNLLTYFV